MCLQHLLSLRWLDSLTWYWHCLAAYLHHKLLSARVCVCVHVSFFSVVAFIFNLFLWLCATIVYEPYVVERDKYAGHNCRCVTNFSVGMETKRHRKRCTNPVRIFSTLATHYSLPDGGRYFK